MSGENTSNFRRQGGDYWEVGGTLNITGVLQDGGVAISPTLGGSYTAVAGDATAGTLDIVTGFSTVTSYTVQILRAGAVATSDVALSVSAGTLTVADGSTYAVTADDVINWIAVGVV
jgi:hypothetical protein